MSLDQIFFLVLFFLIFIVPVIGDFFKKRKKNPLPRSREDFERRYDVRSEERKKAYQRLKPSSSQSLKQRTSKLKQPALEELNQSLSSSSSSKFELELDIKKRQCTSKKNQDLKYSTFLQEQFSMEETSQKDSLLKNLLKKNSLKDIIILNEILNKKY